MLNLNSTKHLESDRVFSSVSYHIDFSLLASFPFLSSVRTASALIPFSQLDHSSPFRLRHVFVSHRIASAPLKSSCHLRTCLFKSFRSFRSDLLDLSRFSSSKPFIFSPVKSVHLFISKLVGSSHPIKSFRPLRVSSPRFGSPHRVKAVRVLFSSLRPFSSTTVIRFFSDRVFAHVRIKSSNLYKPYLFDLSYLVLPFLAESPNLHDPCQTQSERTKSLQHSKPFHLKVLSQTRFNTSNRSESHRFYHSISLNSTIQVK